MAGEILYKKSRKAIQLPISKIFPGMVTAREVFSRNDQLIVNKGLILDSEIIAKLMFYTVESILVYETESMHRIELEQDIYSERLRESMEFRQFIKKYDEAISSVRGFMNSLIKKNVDIDQDEVLQNVNSILYGSRNKMHLLSMLYCIRNYDDSTYMHSINVALICNVFGGWLNLNNEDKDVLTLCGLLHDIGKIAIPKEILNKPGRLSPEEYEIIKQHTAKGYEILKNKKIDERVKRSAILHHERYDGSGYPGKLKGEDIDTYSMIVAIADVYDAMTSSRIYRGPVCPFEVIRLFEDDGYRLYDPQILVPLLEHISGSYINHSVRLNNDQHGEIIMLNRNALSKPLIKLQDDNIIDLSKNSKLKIDAVL